MRYIFKNENVSIGYSTITDGNLIETTALKQFLEKQSVKDIILLKPGGNTIPLLSIKHQDDFPKELVHAHAVIVQFESHVSGGIGVPTADCPALVGIDMKTNTFIILHVGWLQVYTNLIEKTFKNIFSYSLSTPDDILIFSTPGICKDCFIFKGFKGLIRSSLFRISLWNQHLIKHNAHYTFDIQGAIKDQLIQIGIPEKNITLDLTCTFEDKELSSHRRDGKQRTSSNFVIVSKL
ncbi:polyphenol oxidase family protein [Patescibacteria group bacterium]|nr:polyphenol oxidase family protein [Patescibacteria group bacterium]